MQRKNKRDGNFSIYDQLFQRRGGKEVMKEKQKIIERQDEESEENGMDLSYSELLKAWR